MNALVESLNESGKGQIMVRAPVEKVGLSPEGRVTGVVVKGMLVEAPVVISAAGAYNTLVRMMPSSLPPPSSARIRSSANRGKPCSREAEARSPGRHCPSPAPGSPSSWA